METQDAAGTSQRGLKPIEWIAVVTGLLAFGAIIAVFLTVKVRGQPNTTTGRPAYGPRSQSPRVLFGTMMATTMPYVGRG